MSKDRLLDPSIVQERMQPSGLADTAYQMIREAMLSGRIKPGTWLRQRDLAAELGISQVTVREALNRLVAAGLAERERYRGVRAIATDDSSREELLALRAMLEGWAAEQAASRISPADIARLRQLLPRPSGSAATSAGRASQADREFHWVIIRASGRPHLMRLLQYIWEAQPDADAEQTGDFDSRSVRQRANQRLHRQLVEALEARDGRRARELLVEHVQYTLYKPAEPAHATEDTQTADRPPLWLIRTHERQANVEHSSAASHTT